MFAVPRGRLIMAASAFQRKRNIYRRIVSCHGIDGKREVGADSVAARVCWAKWLGWRWINQAIQSPSDLVVDSSIGEKNSSKKIGVASCGRDCNGRLADAHEYITQSVDWITDVGG